MTDVATARTPGPPLADLLAVLRADQQGLHGVRCQQCGVADVQMSDGCRHCGGDDLDQVTISPSGTLYAFTTVHVAFERATPYTVGYVDLDDGPRVLATISPSVLPAPAIGQRGRVMVDDSGAMFVAEPADE